MISSSHTVTETLELGVLGTVEARSNGQLLPLGGPKQRAVLAVLIAGCGRRVSTDEIIDAVYGDDAPQGARRTVQTYVSNLRGALGDVIRSQPDGYVLDAKRDRVDATRFEDLVADAMGRVEEHPEQVADLTREALALWRGHPYADVDGGTKISAEITRLSDLRLAALETRIEADLELGRHEQLVPELEALTTEYPYREKLRALHMQALYRSGRQADALRAYEQTRTTLLEELGIDPSPELQRLQLQILEHDESLAFSPAPPVSRKALLAVDVDTDFVAEAVPPGRRVDVFAATDAAVLDGLARHQGTVFAQRLNTTYAYFEQLADALTAAGAVLRDSPRLGTDDPRCAMRVAVDYGDVEAGSDGSLAGPVVSRISGLVAIAHPGQALMSTAAQAEAASAGGWTIKSLGDHPVPYLDRSEGIHQLVQPGLPNDFPPPRTDSMPVALPGGMRAMPGYELRSQVDRGRHWVAWRAYQPSIGREVAIKVIEPELSSRPEFVRRFELEALTVARLDHPHIVPLYDYWRDLSGAYLVTRWVRGVLLATRTLEGPLSVPEASRLLDHVGAALDAAHQAGVAHGHVSPASIVIDEHGDFFLTDFGIAREHSTSRGVLSDVAGLAATVAASLDGSAQYTQDLADLLTVAPQLSTMGELRAAWAEEVGPDIYDEASYTETRNPYHGLNAFSYADAQDFFGRGSVADAMVSAIETRRFTAVVGPSGVGKSSLVQAGLLPALVDGALMGSSDWFIATMTPGSHPFEALASALLRVATAPVPDPDAEIADGERGFLRVVSRMFPAGGEILVVIDQFEELFTVTDHAIRVQFLRALTAAVKDPASQVRVVATLRADFFDQPLENPEFGELLRAATVPISAPTNDELRAIVERPAAGVGVHLDPALIDRVLRDVGDEPGRLPLLEYALTEMFLRRTSDVIGLEDYEAIGGVVGALGGRAEAIYRDLDPAGREGARQLFLRLVTLPDAERVTRRRVRMTELWRLDLEAPVIETVIDAFSQHRLLTLDRDPVTRGPTVEVAHEALFSDWQRLAGWIEERRDDLAARRRLLEATHEWEESGGQEAMLLGGARLAQLEEWAAATDLSLSASERALLQASAAKRDADTRNRHRRRRFILAGFATAAVIAVVLAAIASVQRSEAQQSRDLATARELSARAITQLATDPEQSLLLALEAVSLGRATGTDSLEATTALRQAVAAHRVVDRFDGGNFVAVSPDGELIVAGNSDGGATIRELDTGLVTAVLDRPDGQAIGAEFSPDGDQVAVFYAAPGTPIWIWDVDGGDRLQLEGPNTAAKLQLPYISYNGESNYVAAWVSGEVRVWSAETGDHLLRLGGFGVPEFIPGTNRVLVADLDESRFRVFDTDTGAQVDSFPVAFPPETYDVSPDGRIVVFTDQNQASLIAYEVASGSEIWRTPVDRSSGVEWLADGEHVAVGSDGGRIVIVDGFTGETEFDLRGGHVGPVWTLAAVPSRALLATSGMDDDTTIVWDVEGGPRAEVARLDTEAGAGFRFAGFAPYPDQVFVSQRDDNGDPATARIIDAATGQTRIEVSNPIVTGGAETRIVGDGSLLATFTTGGLSTLNDARTNEVLYVPPPGRIVRAASYDGQRVLIGNERGESAGGPPQVIDVASGDVIATLDNVYAGLPFFSYDGLWISDRYGVAGDEFALFDATTGEVALMLPEAMAVRPMPDGETISILDESGTLWHARLDDLLAGKTIEEAALWNAFATQGLVVPLGHVANADGSLLSTAARRDEPFKIWDTAMGEQVAELDPDLTQGVPQVFFHPDGPHVTLVGDRGVLLTYTLDTDELIEIARSRLTRSFTDAECLTFLNLEPCPDVDVGAR